MVQLYQSVCITANQRFLFSSKQLYFDLALFRFFLQSLCYTETSAYKQMLSGTFSRTSQKAPVPSDDTDDDVEKEFANVLSPRSPTK